jgi:hypothetical protein
MARIIEVAKMGLPLHFAAKAGDISDEALLQWRRKDPKFARDLEAARLEAVERRWKRIEKAAKGTEEHPPDWKADAWSLERVYPQFFGRPDLQLSVNQSVSTGPTNVVVLGPERAKVLATRHQQIRAKTIARFEGQTGNGERRNEAPPSKPPDLPTFQAVVEEANDVGDTTAPAQEPSPSSAWWRQFLFPVLGVLIHKAEATKALRLVLSELRIAVEERILSFQSDHVTQTTFCEALEKLTGGDLGWRTMVQIYERELRRAGHQS